MPTAAGAWCCRSRLRGRVYEPEAGHRPLPAKALAQLYGLTPAESRLVKAELLQLLALGPRTL